MLELAPISPAARSDRRNDFHRSYAESFVFLPLGPSLRVQSLIAGQEREERRLTVSFSFQSFLLFLAHRSLYVCQEKKRQKKKNERWVQRCDRMNARPSIHSMCHTNWPGLCFFVFAWPVIRVPLTPLVDSFSLTLCGSTSTKIYKIGSTLWESATRKESTDT